MLGFPHHNQLLRITPRLFRPQEYGPCLQWLRASEAGPAPGGVLATWRDLSGNNYHCTTAASWGRPALIERAWKQHAGVGFHLNRMLNPLALTSHPNGITLVTVAQIHGWSGDNWTFLWSTGGTNSTNRRIGLAGFTDSNTSAPYWRIDTYGDAVVSTVAPDKTQPSVIVIVYDPTTAQLRMSINSVAATFVLGSYGIDGGGARYSAIGDLNTGADTDVYYKANATIYELAAINRGVSSSEVGRIIAQLKAAYEF